MMENSLNNTMTTNCRMLTKLLESGSFSMDPEEIDRFAKWVGVDEIFITDADGVTVGSNTAFAIGWRFPDDPNAQAYVFRSLIGQKEGIITQPISIRDLDSQMYKYVGISRTDQPGIVQIGFRAETIMGLEAETSAVFGILAQEIKHLESKVIDASKLVRNLSKEVETGLIENH
jgi:methyl-accepting chemotaxis protein